MFDICLEKGFSTHSSEMKSLLMDYLTNRLGNKCNFDNEEIKKCLSNKIDGFSSTANKKWKESNYCIRKFKKKK